LWGFIGHYSLAWLAASLHSFIAVCEWDSRDRKHHYIKKQWPKRESLIPGEKNAVNTPIINPEKVYLPPLYITLGLTKTFDHKSAGFMYSKNKFPRISDDKIKERNWLYLK